MLWLLSLGGAILSRRRCFSESITVFVVSWSFCFGETGKSMLRYTLESGFEVSGVFVGRGVLLFQFDIIDRRDVS